MKLYTMELVMAIREWQHQWDRYDRDPSNKPKPLSLDDFDEYLDSLNPIELPTENELEKLNPWRIDGGHYNPNAAMCWQKGAECVLRLIKGDK